MPEIVIENISKCFGKDTQALKDFSLTISDGEIISLLGPSGAGKTTLLRLLCGLLKPDSGKIIINGKNITKEPPEKRGIAYLPQTYSLFKHLSVWENTVFGPKLKQTSVEKWEELGNEILSMVGLRSRRYSYPEELSGGMQQRLALARALATDFDILLLDEPLRALDARLRIELREELFQLSKTLQKTVIWVTHDQIEAMNVADRLVILNRGELEQVGVPSSLYNSPDTPFVAGFLGEANSFIGKLTKKTNGSSSRKLITEEGIEIPCESDLDTEMAIAYIKIENCIPTFKERTDSSHYFILNAVSKSYHFMGKSAILTGNLSNKTEIKCLIYPYIIKKHKIEPNFPLSIRIDQKKVKIFPFTKEVENA